MIEQTYPKYLSKEPEIDHVRKEIFRIPVFAMRKICILGCGRYQGYGTRAEQVCSHKPTFSYCFALTVGGRDFLAKARLTKSLHVDNTPPALTIKLFNY